MDRMETQELISALADGQLRGDAFARAVERAAADPQARETWRTYHLIGDVLRSSDLAHGTQQERFVSRLRERLQSESRPQRAETHASTQTAVERPAANDRRWKAIAALASIAAVATLGWTLRHEVSGERPQLASAAAAASQSAAKNPPGMLRDPRLDELLAAHRQLGSATALQTPAGYLRHATFEGPAR